MHIISKCCCSMWRWAWSYVYFSKGAPFISGLVLSFTFLDSSYVALLISYIYDDDHDDDNGIGTLRNATVITTAMLCLRTFAGIILNHIAENCIGDFQLIIYSFPALFIGLLLSLWRFFSPEIGTGIFYLSSALLMIGSAGLDVSLYPFLCHQFAWTMDNIHETAETTGDDQFLAKKVIDEYNDTLHARADVWNCTATFLGNLASWVFGSTYTKKKTIIVSLVFVGISFLVFCSGKCCYVPEAPEGRKVASVVKRAKPLVKLIPLWITFISCSLLVPTGFTLFLAQSVVLESKIDVNILNYHIHQIPLSTFFALPQFTSFIASFPSGILIKKFWSEKETIQHRATFVRVGIGMLFASVCCITAWRVEVLRLSNLDDQDAMTILWLAPQFCLLGIMDGLFTNGLGNFFNDRVPISMRFLSYPFNGSLHMIGKLISIFSVLVAGPWIGDDIDQSRLDLYFLMLAILNLFSLFAYILLFCKYDWNVAVPQNGYDVPVEEASSPMELEIECDDVPVEEASSLVELEIECDDVPVEEATS